MTVTASRGTTATGTQSNGSWANPQNAVDGAPGTSPGTFAVWTSSAGSVWGALEISGYNLSAIPGDEELVAVRARIRHLANTAARHTVVLQAYDGATPLGSAEAVTAPGTTAAVVDVTLPLTLTQVQLPGFRVRVTATRTNQGGSVTYSVDHIDVEVETRVPPAPLIPTLAGHIAALRRVGAVAIWPLDDGVISSGENFREATGQDWALFSRGGQAGVPGPYPDASAYQPVDVQADPYVNPNLDPSQPWPISIRQPEMTVCFWVYVNQRPASFGQCLFWWTGGPMPSSAPYWWYWTTGYDAAGIAWPSGVNPLLVDPVTTAQLNGRWAHIASVLEGSQVRLYLDGERYGAATISPAAGTGTPYSFWLETTTGLGVRYQAVALFDRALTDQEVEDLIRAPAEEAGVSKVWDGSNWIPGKVGGWDGSQWRPAKVWNGSAWREL